MAREHKLRCDLCRKEVDRIAMKILAIPLIPGRSGRHAHSMYSHHADLCDECRGKLFGVVKFQVRRTKTEYQNDRRKKQVGVGK